MAEIAARNQQTDPAELNLQPATVITETMNSQSLLDLELTFPAFPLGQSGQKGATRRTRGFISRPKPSYTGQRGQPDIPEDSFLDLSLQYTGQRGQPDIPEDSFLDLSLQYTGQRGQPDIPEDSFLDLSLQFTPCDPISPDEALNDDAGSSRRARGTHSFDSESEISARNQQSDPLEHNLQPPTVITESHVAPVAPLPPPSPPLPTYTCPICLGPMTEETTTRCGHIFCEGCIIRSLSSVDKCPICWHRITPRGLHRLYFDDAL